MTWPSAVTNKESPAVGRKGKNSEVLHGTAYRSFTWPDCCVCRLLEGERGRRGGGGGGRGECAVAGGNGQGVAGGNGGGGVVTVSTGAVTLLLCEVDKRREEEGR